ncbi:MAG: glucose-6-phosphate dehydrogenase assembly protein OpcA [Gaiellaceae bacterium]
MEWAGADVTVSEVEQRLARLRMEAELNGAAQRTSVATHIAWVPEPWLPAAIEVLRGLAERHPSRTIVLVPEPDAGKASIDAELELSIFPLGEDGRSICTETVLLRLRGARAHAPASIVTPLLISDLPVFCRWRGEPPFGLVEFEQLLGVVDRLVVDSEEWEDLPFTYKKLAGELDRTAISDIAWQRLLPWRAALARLWPGIAEASTVHVAGPQADALLLAAWLRTRLRRDDLLLEHDAAAALEHVAVDREPVVPVGLDPLTPSDLLSNELDRFGRDPIYEQALRSF